MPKLKFETVDQYLRTLPREAQDRIESVRQTVRKAAPKAVETISYQIPAFKLNGGYLVYFAAWKHHIGMYPVPAAMRDELERYRGGKGTIQFSFAEPLPLALIRRIVKQLMNEQMDREARA
jgi:uncharacterized protein YdhG (YjbR/CyaY superfamily)